MTRKIIAYSFHIEPLQFAEPLHTWLCQQATTKSWLLAHATDGVIWGLVSRNSLRASHDVASTVSPPLRIETLQHLRLFNADYEVKLWRGDAGWQAIRITDVPESDAAAIDEQQLLWGTYAERLADGFIRLKDGAQGLVHVIPPFDGSEQLASELGSRRDEHLTRVYLSVRHYLTEDALGVNTITMSRSMGLGVKYYG